MAAGGGLGTMAAATAARGVGRRKEPRQRLVRLVDYAPFPRIRGGQGERCASTRDVSTSGTCLLVDVAEPVGTLLRLIVRGADGRPTLEALGRVTWSRRMATGGSRLGVALLPDTHRRMRRAAKR